MILFFSSCVCFLLSRCTWLVRHLFTAYCQYRLPPWPRTLNDWCWSHRYIFHHLTLTSSSLCSLLREIPILCEEKLLIKLCRYSLCKIFIIALLNSCCKNWKLTQLLTATSPVLWPAEWNYRAATTETWARRTRCIFQSGFTLTERHKITFRSDKLITSEYTRPDQNFRLSFELVVKKTQMTSPFGIVCSEMLQFSWPFWGDPSTSAICDFQLGMTTTMMMVRPSC